MSQAIMEEADLRLGEMKKVSYEFERDVVKGSVNPRTGKVIAEKVSRHWEEKLKARVRTGLKRVAASSVNMI